MGRGYVQTDMGSRSGRRDFWRYWRLRLLLGLLLLVGGFFLVWALSPRHTPRPLTSTEAPAPPFGSLSLEQILARHYEASGGLERQLALKSMTLTGRMNLKDRDFDFTLVKRAPNLVRLTMNDGPRKLVYAYDGAVAWTSQGGSDPQEARPLGPAETADLVRDAPLTTPLFDHERKGYHLELTGTGQAGGFECYLIRATSRNGDVFLYYLDGRFFMERRLEMERSANLGGGKIVTEFHRFRDFNGLKVPVEVTNLEGERPTMRLVVNKVEFDAGILPEIFRYPGATGAPGTVY